MRAIPQAIAMRPCLAVICAAALACSRGASPATASCPATVGGGGCGYFGELTEQRLPSCLPYPYNACFKEIFSLVSCDPTRPALTITAIQVGPRRTDLVVPPPFDGTRPTALVEVGGVPAESGSITWENADDYGVQGAFDVTVAGAQRTGRFDARWRVRRSTQTRGYPTPVRPKVADQAVRRDTPATRAAPASAEIRRRSGSTWPPSPIQGK